MIKPIIGRQKVFTLAAAGTMFFSGCTGNTAKISSYMKNMGANSQEIERIIAGTKNNDKYVEAVQRQSALDSMAYRNLFNTTELARDSIAISMFNQIASKTALKYSVNSTYSEKFNKDRCIDRMLEVVCAEDYDEETVEKMKDNCFNLDAQNVSLTAYQKEFDKMYYENLFKGLSLTDNPDFANRFNSVSKSVATL